MKLNKTVIRKVAMKEANDEDRGLQYWLKQSVSKRLEAVTLLISQSLKPGQRMDKTQLRKCRLQDQ